MKNYFLKEKNPSLWSLKVALAMLEKENSLKTQKDHLKELKALIKVVTDRGDQEQKEAAKDILRDWSTECQKLTHPSIHQSRNHSSNEGSGNVGHMSAQTTTNHFHGNVHNVITNSFGGACSNQDDKRAISPSPSNGHSDSQDTKTWNSINTHPHRRLIHLYLSYHYFLQTHIHSPLIVTSTINLTAECFSYRSKSINGAQNRYPLNDARILSLSFVFLLSTNETCILTPLRNPTPVLQACQINKELVYVDDKVVLSAKKMLDIYNNGDGEEQLKGTLSQISDSDNITSPAAIHSLSKVADLLIQWRSETTMKEEDLIKTRLQCFIDATFGKLPNASSSWSVYELKPSKKSSDQETFLPDYVLYNQKVDSTLRFEFCCIEVKSAGRNNGESDMVRVGKELKLMMDKLTLYGVHDPVVVGILVRGLKIQFFKMIIGASGMYLMVEIDNLNLLRASSDITLVPSLIERFYQLKTIAAKTQDQLYEAYDAARHSRNNQHTNTLKENTPSSFLRPACGPPTLQEVKWKKKTRHQRKEN